jgi:hypothetical protein
MDRDRSRSRSPQQPRDVLPKKMGGQTVFDMLFDDELEPVLDLQPVASHASSSVVDPRGPAIDLLDLLANDRHLPLGPPDTAPGPQDTAPGPQDTATPISEPASAPTTPREDVTNLVPSGDVPWNDCSIERPSVATWPQAPHGCVDYRPARVEGHRLCEGRVLRLMLAVVFRHVRHKECAAFKVAVLDTLASAIYGFNKGCLKYFEPAVPGCLDVGAHGPWAFEYWNRLYVYLYHKYKYH